MELKDIKVGDLIIVKSICPYTTIKTYDLIGIIMQDENVIKDLINTDWGYNKQYDEPQSTIEYVIPKDILITCEVLRRVA